MRIPTLVVVQRPGHPWALHFAFDGDPVTRCGLDTCGMSVCHDDSARLLRLRSCRRCAKRVTVEEVRALCVDT